MGQIKQAVGWPLRRALDPRLVPLADLVESTHQTVREVGGGVGQVRDEVRGARDRMDARLAELEADVQDRLALTDARISDLEAVLARVLSESGGAQVSRLVGGPLELVDAHVAALLDYADSTGGYRAAQGLWPFPGLRVRYAAGAVTLAEVGHLMAAVPFAHRALAGLGPGARVLDLSSPEAVLAPALKALGMECVRVGASRGPLTAVATLVDPAALFEPAAVAFDGVVCLSGLHAVPGEPLPGEEPAPAALRRLLPPVVAPGAVLVVAEPATSGRDIPEDAGWALREKLIVGPRSDGPGWAPAARATEASVTLAALVAPSP